MASPALRISTGPIRWQSSTEAEAGKFQNDSSKNIHSPFVLLPSLCSKHLCPDALPLPFCDYCFERAGSIYGFICSRVLGGKGLFLILTNSTLTLLARKSYYFFYILLGFIFLLFPFSRPTWKEYF